MKIIEDEDRDLIPRWRRFDKSLDETRSISPPSSSGGNVQDISPDLLTEWEESPNLTLASEIVSSAYLTNSKQTALSAARMVAESANVTGIANKLAMNILGKPVEDERHSLFEEDEWVRQVRVRTNRYPRDPIAWVDLALAYVISGKMKSADRALKVAVSLAPDDRFVLRSVARFYVHQNESEVALHILRKSLATKHDPWLISTEIALCEALDRTSPLTKLGRTMVLKPHLPPHHVAELSGEIATVEYRHGSIRNATKLFKKSLIDPTENAVAQASWASRREKAFELSGIGPSPLSPEAVAWEAYREGDWKRAGDFSTQWFNDQPFSVRPVLLGSCAQGIALENYSEAIKMCEKSVKCNPDEILLLNNCAFNLAMNNQVEKAEQYFDRIPGEIEDKEKATATILIATRGLLRIKGGHIDAGISDYKRAITIAAENRDFDRAVMAFSNLALELLAINRLEDAKQMIKAATEVEKLVNDKLSLLVLSRAKERIFQS
ncbi:hypothetical protein ACFL3K_01270 [Pseudomonadota bacterium]